MTENQFKQYTEWQRETFKNATPASKVQHLSEEIQELLSDLLFNAEDRRLEFADCFLLLFGAAAADGMTYDQICQAIDEKMIINQARKWGEPDSNGVVKHIK